MLEPEVLAQFLFVLSAIQTGHTPGIQELINIHIPDARCIYSTGLSLRVRKGEGNLGPNTLSEKLKTLSFPMLWLELEQASLL